MTALFLVAAFVLVAVGGLLAACDAAMVTLSRAELQEIGDPRAVPRAPCSRSRRTPARTSTR